MTVDARRFRFISMLTGRLNPRRVDRLATFFSLLFFRILRIRSRVISHNIHAAFPQLSPSERNVLAYQSFRNFLMTILETLSASWRNLSSDVTIEGADRFREALAQGKGCLILCIHMGNWEALAGAVSQQIAPTHVIVKKVGKGFVNDLVAWLRQRLGYHAIPSDRENMPAKQIFKALSRNEMVGFVMDQYQPGAPELPLFGYPTKTNTGLAAIWRRTGVPVFPLVIRRISPFQHQATVWPEMTLQKTQDAAADILHNTAAFNAMMEKMILSAPDQYFWLHDRWKWKRRSPDWWREKIAIQSPINCSS